MLDRVLDGFVKWRIASFWQQGEGTRLVPDRPIGRGLGLEPDLRAFASANL
jgi:hypothetical protein